MSINAKGNLQGVVTTQQELKGNISAALELIGNVNAGGVILPEYYEGEYEITPRTEAQVLDTKDKFLKDNVVVAPIPKEYGLVTYNQDKTITIT